MVPVPGGGLLSPSREERRPQRCKISSGGSAPGFTVTLRVRLYGNPARLVAPARTSYAGAEPLPEKRSRAARRPHPPGRQSAAGWETRPEVPASASRRVLGESTALPVAGAGEAPSLARGFEAGGRRRDCRARIVRAEEFPCDREHPCKGVDLSSLGLPPRSPWLWLGRSLYDWTGEDIPGAWMLSPACKCLFSPNPSTCP